MNMFKKNGGFTLVELIVVIAILAILAGVAIPAYSGYITKAQDAAIVVELDAIQTAAQAANATKGEIDSVTVSNNGAKITVSAANGLATNYVNDFTTFYTAASNGTLAQDGKSCTFTITAMSNWETSTYKDGAKWLKTAADSLKAGWNATTVAD